MTLEELDRLEARAHDLTGAVLSTAIALTPGQVLSLCRHARSSLQEPLDPPAEPITRP